jgi:hypothetical protein
MNATQMKNAIKGACKDTTFILSAHLRSEARASGWPEHIARSVHVRHGAKGFTTHVHPQYKGEALDLEYGRPGQNPTAAMRRGGHRTEQAEHFLIKRTAYHLGGKK